MVEAAGGGVTRRAQSGRGVPWGWIVLGLLLLALIAGVIFGLPLLRAEPDTSVQQLDEALAEVERAPAAPAVGAWRPLAPLSLPRRTEQTSVWTGRELLVWGGTLDDGFGPRTFHADGAALDPAAGTWRTLPAAPLDPRTDHVAVWTGRELLVWGGTGRSGLLADGATLEPGTGRWRPLPASPLAPRADAAAVWTGSRLLVVGGTDNGGPLTDGATYEPASGAWRPIATPPAELTGGEQLRATWTGTAAVVWTADRSGLGRSAVARYDPAADAWTLLPDPVGDTGMVLPVLTQVDQRLYGLRVTPDGTAAELLALDDSGTAWQPAPAPAPVGDPWQVNPLWTGSALVFAAGDGAGGLVYRPADEIWSTLPAAPAAASGVRSTAWTGSELLVVGGQAGEGPEGTGAAAWAFSG